MAKQHFPPILRTAVSVAVAYTTVSLSTGALAEAIVDGWRYPIGSGGQLNRDRFDGDGWYIPQRPELGTNWGQDWGQQSGVSSVFGWLHAGEDWNTDVNSNDIDMPVYAAANGVVVAQYPRFLSTENANIVVLEHTIADASPNKKLYSVYVHVDPLSSVTPGKVFRKGDQIATIADLPDTEQTNGTFIDPSHLHFELRSKPVAPYEWPNSKDTSAYYETFGDLLTDGIDRDPSNYIDANRQVVWRIGNGDTIDSTHDTNPLQILVGDSTGNGTLNIGPNSGGRSTVTTSHVSVGLDNEGEILVEDSSLLISMGINIGWNDTGIFTLEHGAYVESNGFSVGVNSGAENSILTITGPNTEYDGTIGDFYSAGIGRNTDGKVRILNGGKLTLLGAALGENVSGSGHIDVDGVGSELIIERDSLGVGRQGWGELRIINGGYVTGLNAVIGYQGGDGMIVVDGSGSHLDLDTGLYSGPGRVEVRNGGKITAPELVVQAGGEFYQNGEIDGQVIIRSGGFYAPGNSVGKATITGDLVLQSGSLLQLEIENGKLDELEILGNVFLEGGTFVEIYTDIAASLINLDDFFTASLPSFQQGFGGDRFLLYTSDSSLVGMEVDVTFGGNIATRILAFGTTAVPMPGTLPVFAAGLAGFALFRRKRRNNGAPPRNS